MDLPEKRNTELPDNMLEQHETLQSEMDIISYLQGKYIRLHPITKKH